MTAALSWNAAPHQNGRASILKALRIDPSDPASGFATAPFRIVMDDGLNWIAGAVGCPPHLSWPEIADWTPDAISDVILWNPRTAETRIMGEAKSQSIAIIPNQPDEETTVYASGFSFFRAWADRRAELWARIRAHKDKKWVHPVTEPADSAIPGILIVGDIDKIHWRDLGCTVLRAADDIDQAALKRAILRSANLPQVANSYIARAA